MSLPGKVQAHLISSRLQVMEGLPALTLLVLICSQIIKIFKGTMLILNLSPAPQTSNS